MSVLNALFRRYAYHRTLHTLNTLPAKTRFDCDIVGHEAELAHRAVYGN
ncbi:glyceraldehyde-3-phosphate dehydrogenase [Citreicella sp. C3M06]|nr:MULTISPECIES: glyceraldehyde-3-phosphate dehydrogenase [Roseobacteraceae]MBU2962189.1 glyceraldehyde-3-phosphate dehydrogenase [Citreicella sp. C3M06]MDO6585446.1 glyceraldehyde-3-phosphate dehydrogenase [Salipiger sp. 1_MG-2023]